MVSDIREKALNDEVRIRFDIVTTAEEEDKENSK